MVAKEKWSPIKEYEDYYAISNFGNVKSVERKVKNRNGYRIVKERILKPSISNKGYYLVALSKNGKSHTLAIHKMVMEHFNRCAFDYEVINHIDHNKLNNNISNLEYITQKENVKDAWNNGLCENIRKQAKNNIIKAYSSRRNNYGKC